MHWWNLIGGQPRVVIDQENNEFELWLLSYHNIQSTSVSIIAVCLMEAIHKQNLTFPYISFTFWDYEQFHVYHPTFFPYIIILIHTSIITPLVQDKAKYCKKIFH